ncbi:MAG: hypothetical protein H0U49_00040 [Parachlamydiaceae bacterium]|nr:hypothetical protein [Parachlamydiaceae bacterium]
MKEIDIGYDNATIELSAENLKTMINALSEVDKEIDEWEFETRMGITKEKAYAISYSLAQICENIQVHNRKN